MIKSIYIKNFVIIGEYSIEFSAGLNIITGETGSGKSLVFKALNILLGGRASLDLVRKGEKKSILEAKFDQPDLKSLLTVLNDPDFYEQSKEIIIRREFTSSGQSRSFLNDSPVSVQELKKIRNLLLDYHGQHSTTRILESDYQRKILDKFGNNSNILVIFREQFFKTKKLISELRKFKSKREELLKNLDFWKFRLEEILEVDPKEGEQEEIESELRLIENSEMLFSMAAESNKLLYDSSKSAYQKINEAISIFEKLSEYDPEFNNFSEDLNSAVVSVREAGRYASEIKDRIDFDPIRIEELRTRSSQIRLLSKKFGPIDKVIKEKSELEENINSAENFDGKIDELSKEIEKEKIKLNKLAKELTNSRENAAAQIVKAIQKEFMLIGMENARFNIRFYPESEGIDLSENTKVSEYGLEKIVFELAANKGQNFAELTIAASGGEMSRIMLAIKKLLKEKEEIDLLVFDEIDSGISGKTAALVGKYIKELAGKVQILSITHQPQIAAGASRHILIEKIEQPDISYSTAKILNSEESIRETAKLFSGENVSEESIKSAQKLFEI